MFSKQSKRAAFADHRDKGHRSNAFHSHSNVPGHMPTRMNWNDQVTHL
jgi:hypothetical protein